MSKKYKKTCKYLNLLALFSFNNYCWVVCVLVSITSSAVGIKICAITAGFEKYKSIIKKK